MSKQEPISLERLLAQHERDRAEIARLDVALVRAQTTLARVAEWAHIFGAALKPRGADTYGEGVRDAKAQVSLILRSDPHAVVKPQPAHFACAPDESPPPSDNPADLTDEDREALASVRASVQYDWPGGGEMKHRALAALDKLLGKKTDHG